VQGESHPFDVDLIFLLQSINTDRTEIAPRSDII
jgi:hypothetical protein